MGFLKDLVGIAAPIAGTIIGGPVGGAIGGALGGLASGSGQPKSHTTTQQQQLNPRIEQMLFGNGGDNKGLLSQYQGFMSQPRSDAATGFANANAQYLNNNGAADLAATRGAAYQAMQGNTAPTMNAASAAGGYASLPAYAVGEKVNAPSQNNIDLSASYNSLINGAPGANPYLTGAIQKGINQSSNAFGNMVTDAKAATQDVLGSIRGNSVLAGQFGGSRQGIAEGKAIDSMNTNLARAASQFGQNNTDAAVAAQTGAYDSDRNRQLAATQGLGAQQYGVAQQEAAYAQQAQMQNVQNSFDASKTNASMAQQNNQFNAGLQQQAGLANQQAQLATNGQNTSAGLAGAGLLSGLLGNASNQVNANDNWGLGRAQGVNSLLAPYLGANSSSSSSQPVYSNSVGNALGGAMMGGQLGGLFGSGGFSSLFGPGTIGAGF
ncbi:hypothetical protein [Massilia oculi]|uniref:hypothetical protein n=1 Tax=Massilia oculi TaxID=945844 RepID=UPI001AAE90E8|nr:hypothetical protein [Massilia oculi]